MGVCAIGVIDGATVTVMVAGSAAKFAQAQEATIVDRTPMAPQPCKV